ncbi:MAG: hypothetical protein ACYC2E_17755, partial [Sulfuricella sp.]
HHGKFRVAGSGVCLNFSVITKVQQLSSVKGVTAVTTQVRSFFSPVPSHVGRVTAQNPAPNPTYM